MWLNYCSLPNLMLRIMIHNNECCAARKKVLRWYTHIECLGRPLHLRSRIKAVSFRRYSTVSVGSESCYILVVRIQRLVWSLVACKNHKDSSRAWHQIYINLCQRHCHKPIFDEYTRVSHIERYFLAIHTGCFWCFRGALVSKLW